MLPMKQPAAEKHGGCNPCLSTGQACLHARLHAGRRCPTAPNCAPQVPSGVVPNQHGTFLYGRCAQGVLSSCPCCGVRLLLLLGRWAGRLPAACLLSPPCHYPCSFLSPPVSHPFPVLPPPLPQGRLVPGAGRGAVGGRRDEHAAPRGPAQPHQLPRHAAERQRAAAASGGAAHAEQPGVLPGLLREGTGRLPCTTACASAVH